jgi:hypothetical protein
MVGLGVSDLQHAARAEVQRIIKETRGDELAQSKLLLGKLRERDLITDTEVDALSRIAEVGREAGGEKGSARQAYFESRDMLNTLVARGDASPVALVLASSAVGSYTVTEDRNGSGTVVVAKTSGSWEDRGKLAGALIGATWGPAGAAIGGAVGGIVGAAVDECTED